MHHKREKDVKELEKSAAIVKALGLYQYSVCTVMAIHTFHLSAFAVCPDTQGQGSIQLYLCHSLKKNLALGFYHI